MKQVYLTAGVYRLCISSVVFFLLSAIWPVLFLPAVIWLFFWLIVLLYDGWTVYVTADLISGNRNVFEKLSLGDEQTIQYTIHNASGKDLMVTLYDELPVQFQCRTAIGSDMVPAGGEKQFYKNIFPTERGKYTFGKVYVMLAGKFPRLISIKINIGQAKDIHVFPSILQMKKYEMMMVSKTAHQMGLRKVRLRGENDEFEHIRHYQQGDNIKAINWKAAARKMDVLVNTFHDTRSQEVYCIIDKGRTMEMPFSGMTLMDYAINTTLTFSNIVLQKFDKAGLITFSNKIDDVVAASSQPHHLHRIQEVLYNQTTDFKESDYHSLYYFLRRNVRKRSIVFLFTNFEDQYEVERNIPFLRLINRYHLLIVICFVNREIEVLANQQAADKTGIYQSVVARNTMLQRNTFLSGLTAFGIQLILVKPEDLSIQVINKYLEIKSKRMR
jgi:uncharacterized protein (DUF58 family)